MKLVRMDSFGCKMVGEILEGNVVKTCYGDKYQVSASDIEWLKSKSNIEVGDIKSVGFKIYE